MTLFNMIPSRLFMMLWLAFLMNDLWSQNDIRVEPPFWWTDMENSSLQLMIHGENISDCEISLSSSEVSIEAVHRRLQNSNYLWVDLEIQTNATLDFFHIFLKKSGNKRKQKVYTYELKSLSNKTRGISPSDFIYLLMPDRFSNGDPSNDQIRGMLDQSLNRDSMYHRHGGDLQGVLNHIDYFEELSIGALWLNPIIENDESHESYHGYAATDLYNVDARFGDNALYKRLVDELHQKEIKVIQDVVYNHWGDNHWMLSDLPDSSFVHQWPSFQRTNYRATSLMDPYASDKDKKIMTDGWFDHHMPDLDQTNPLLSNYLIQNSIWWIEAFDLDAFRIDTYAYPDQDFMSELSSRILGQYPDFTIFGETWVHGSAVQRWFVEGKPGQKNLDSHMPGVTDFQLYYALNEALSRPPGWAEGLNRVYYTFAKDYLQENPMANVIFLDNHDLSRFYSMVGEDLDKYRIGMGWLLTMRGIPCMYYGTENLMKNFSDPDGKVREDFLGGWADDSLNYFIPENLKNEKREAFTFVSKLAAFRKNHPHLFNGGFKHFVPNRNTYVYFRSGNGEKLMVACNVGDLATELDLKRFEEYIDVLSGEDVITKVATDLTDSLTLPPKSIQIIHLKPE